MTITIGYVCGFIGAGLTLTSYMMKSMMPLRLIALAGCIFFVAYGWLEAALPSLLLYGAMIPINAKKAWELRKLIQAIEKAKSDTPVSEWLLPHMTRRKIKAGQILWNKGDMATEMIYLESGTLRITEYQKLLEPGSIIGEIGLFAPEDKRTLSIASETDCTIFVLTRESMTQLYYKNPKLGYHMMRLIVERLINDTQRN